MPSSESFLEFLGEEVVDEEGHVIGKLACYWEKEEGKPIFLGIHCNQDERLTHVVPAKGSRLNVEQVYVRIAFPRALVERAPCLDCDCELDREFNERVYSHYGLGGSQTEAGSELRKVLSPPRK